MELQQQRLRFTHKIKILQQSKRRSDKKIAEMKTVLKSLKRKKFLDVKQLDVLDTLGGSCAEVFKYALNKAKK